MARLSKIPTVISGPDEPAPRDHNQPPEVLHAGLDLTPEQWSEWLQHVFEPVSQALGPLLEMDGRFKEAYALRPAPIPGDPPIGIDKWDDNVMARAATMRERFRDILKQVEHLHALEKAPVLTAGRAIDGEKNKLIQKIAIFDGKGRLLPGADAPLNRISDRCTVYARWAEEKSRQAAKAEADRLAEEARRQIEAAQGTMQPDDLAQAASAITDAEQAADHARAPAADHTRVQGVAGGVMSLRTNWAFKPEKSDLMALVEAVAAGAAQLDYLTFNTTRLNYAVRTEKIRAIPGCVIEDDKRV